MWSVIAIVSDNKAINIAHLLKFIQIALLCICFAGDRMNFYEFFWCVIFKKQSYKGRIQFPARNRMVVAICEQKRENKKGVSALLFKCADAVAVCNYEKNICLRLKSQKTFATKRWRARTPQLCKNIHLTRSYKRFNSTVRHCSFP